MTQIRKQYVYCAGIFYTVILIVLVKTNSFPYFRSDGVTTDNGYSCLSSEGETFDKSSDIPKHIHQIFFNMTDKVIPDRLENARRSWFMLHPGFQYTLWNASMIDHLIITRYPQLRDLYYSYGHWIRRVDMARYVVLHEFGGIYIDLDIRSTGEHLHGLYNTFRMTTGVVLYLTNPPIVSNDFMISKSHHPFLKQVLCGLEPANRWYVLPYITTMFTTGPVYLHSQYKIYNKKYEIELLEPSVMSQYVRHIRGSSWHQWDGKIIWWTFTHTTHVYIACIALLLTLILIILIWKYRQLLINARRRCFT